MLFNTYLYSWIREVKAIVSGFLRDVQIRQFPSRDFTYCKRYWTGGFLVGDHSFTI